jgi:phosphate transporter
MNGCHPFHWPRPTKQVYERNQLRAIESIVALEAKADKIPPPSALPDPSSTRSAGRQVQEPAASTRQTPPGHRQRGGSIHRATSDSPPDQIELVEYPTAAQKYHDAVRERERRYDTKRAEKRRWLEEQDEMKFSHSIQFNAVPDWSNHYIAYSNLKKL